MKDLKPFVLSKFRVEDDRLLQESLKHSRECIELLIESGANTAMNFYNRSYQAIVKDKQKSKLAKLIEENATSNDKSKEYNY
jgi:ABC-type ATPase with predicted acetyltransferase domain